MTLHVAVDKAKTLEDSKHENVLVFFKAAQNEGLWAPPVKTKPPPPTPPLRIPSSASTLLQASLALPPNWVAYAATNENHGGGEVGQVFYHNATSGKSQWTVPAHDPHATAAAEPSADPEDGSTAKSTTREELGPPMVFNTAQVEPDLTDPTPSSVPIQKTVNPAADPAGSIDSTPEVEYPTSKNFRSKSTVTVLRFAT